MPASGEVTDVLRRVASGVARNASSLLLVHVIYTLLALTVLTPLTAVLVRALVALSGGAVIADQQILEFVLTPVGAAALVMITAILVTLVALEQAAMMAIGFADLQGWHVSAWQAIGFSIRRARSILGLAAWIVIRALVIAAPFLAVGGAIYLWLLTDYDINYYLAAKPREFWIAVSLIGIVLLVMSLLLLRRLTAWSLALPLLLFLPSGARRAMRLSEQATADRRLRVALWWAAWLALVVVVNAVLFELLDRLGEAFVPAVSASLPRVLGSISLLVGAAAIAGTIIAAFQAATFALLELSLLDRWLPGLREAAPQIGSVTREAAVPASARRIIGWGLASALVLAIVAGYAVVSSVRPVDDVEIIAHRGAAGRAPENTLASIRAAIDDGADWVEIDVQESADGQVVVVHDSDFMKLAGVDLKVWNGTFAEIRAVDVGAWFGSEFVGERVPTLGEVLDLARGRARVVIELKYYGHDQRLEERVAGIVEAAGMSDQVAIMSLDYRGVEKFRALRPEWPVGVLMARGVGRIGKLDVDFVAVNAGMATRSLIRSAHAAGKRVYVWTINDPGGMSSMLSLGVDALITDEPAMARSVLEQRADMNVAERLLIQMADRFDWLPSPRQYRDQSP